jgi:peptidoglycan/xylan/chitin deacetylase (PgdA/CDA1 family)
MPQVPAALSVDLEFFQHAPAYRNAAGTADADALGSDGVSVLLEAFETADARGTFFTVSDIADSHPGLVEDVAAAGHEIGSHTHTHRHLSGLSERDRRAELVDSKARLEAVSGTTVEGFRAPSFDVGDDHFEEVSEAGYTYDSSVVPCRAIPGWYGGEFSVREPSPVTAIDPGGPPGLTEVPVAVMPGLRLPLSGTWIRFFGVRYTLLGMRLLARRGIPPVLYVHPWELIDLPGIEGVPRRIYVRSGAYMRRAVKRILAEPFEFVTVGELAERRGGETASHNGAGTGGAR